MLCKICHETLAVLGRDGVLRQEGKRHAASTEERFVYVSSRKPYLCWAPYSY